MTDIYILTKYRYYYVILFLSYGYWMWRRRWTKLPIIAPYIYDARYHANPYIVLSDTKFCSHSSYNLWLTLTHVFHYNVLPGAICCSITVHIWLWISTYILTKCHQHSEFGFWLCTGNALWGWMSLVHNHKCCAQLCLYKLVMPEREVVVCFADEG